MAINKVVYGENTLIDLTDTTATADKILTGYGAYGADGVWMNGTATAGGSVTQDQDGFIVLPPTGGGGGGGGGLEYESGTWTPTEDIARGTINFTGTHSEKPIYVTLSDVSSASTISASSNLGFCYVDTYKMFGAGVPYSTSSLRYGYYSVLYYTGSGAISTYQYFYDSDTEGSTSGYPSYWVTETGFNPYTNSDTRYWRSNRTYKWIAVWKPTT